MSKIGIDKLKEILLSASENLTFSNVKIVGVMK